VDRCLQKRGRDIEEIDRIKRDVQQGQTRRESSTDLEINHAGEHEAAKGERKQGQRGGWPVKVTRPGDRKISGREHPQQREFKKSVDDSRRDRGRGRRNW